jgi:putative transposase
MPKARYLAPWQQVDLMEKFCAGAQELDMEALAALRGKPAIYHCISRVVDRRFVLGTREKEKFVALMRLYEQFCQVRVLTFCVMSNHFHILLEVPSPPPERGRDWSDEKLLDHLSQLYSAPKLAEIRWWLAHFRAQENHSAAEELRDSFFARMWDLSEFMKPLKQCFTRWFNREHERHGTLWEERFKSVLVEDGHAARVVAAYIDLNPVRAGIVKNPEDYRWCSYGEAMGGKQRAREGIQRVMLESAGAWNNEEQAAEIISDWRAAVGRYREVLFAYLRRGTEQEDTEATRLTEVEVLGQQVRHFIDGMVIGLQPFVDRVFQLTRERFGPKRKDGARKIGGIDSELRAMRNLT